ncbi:type VI secretion system-associated FHA domain protein TagH [Pseudomonas sp. CAN2814]|uniref:type VI secretion system-associated FHA domain protein TagH n=1 Tax=Pseudomonas sp. CAN1 TaxID=3046726 RepID=UPI002649A8B9|nr:type VI secretion system-associated FHA domain protein TagH [Pseudomonas sp. CAN1]MDN6859263.1 type VI secretion system-associated FHA domain protein TagH [Pseudomonas sp. CAN1]
MALRLTITSYHKITPGQCPEMTLESGVMAIGRNSDNDWVLPDPARLVSSRHCLVQYKDGRYYLTDNSTNGVELVHAGVRMRRGSSELLEDGEVIRIGDYEIQARIESALGQGSSPFVAAESANSFEALMAAHQNGPAAIAETPFSPSASAHLQGVSPQETLPDLFDFLAPTTPAPAPVSDHVPAERHDFRPPAPTLPPPPAMPSVVTPEIAPPSAGAGLIPADWDLLGDTPPAVDPFATANPFAPVEPPAALSVQSTPMPVPMPEPLQPAVAPTTEVPAAPREQLAAPREAPPQPPRAVEPAPSDELLQAFLRGAGLERLRLDPQQAAAQMESIGRSYRLMVEGLIDVLRARSSLKGEFRMQQTLVRPVENNPLKFAPNADEALLLLLRGGSPAFMAADQAVGDGFNDLRAHQLAVMAGVEAAIKHLLARFEPQALEARMGKGGGLASLLPGARQAQSWQQFVELYATLSREAEEDFQDLFGREFGRAYEQHIVRLRQP